MKTTAHRLFIAGILSIALGLAAFSGPAVGAESLLERGTYLMQSIVACGNCHTPKTEKGVELPGMELAGGLRIVEHAFDVLSPNITQDKETGIGAWSDAQIINAIRNGKRPDGSTIGPPMPAPGFYQRMSDGDVRAIVAYLRTVKPVRNKIKRNTYAFPLPPNYGPKVTHIAEMPRGDKVKYGAYLAGPLGHCILCHTPFEKGRFKFDTHLGAGGLDFIFPFGTVYSANITPDRKTGIGAWSDAQIKRAITKGIGKNGEHLLPPMPFSYFSKISDDDLNAILAYLRTMKPLPEVRKTRMTPAK